MNLKTILLASLLAVSAPAIAAGGDATAGKKKSEPCKACHGETGMSIAPDFPNIAGQHFDYIVAALNHYKNGKRKNEIMKGQAANLSVKDINDLAAYYAGQKGLAVKY